jgi:hypothetical protein
LKKVEPHLKLETMKHIQLNLTYRAPTNVTIQNSKSLIKCAAECVAERKCCAAIYSNASMVCHLDISGNYNWNNTKKSIIQYILVH